MVEVLEYIADHMDIVVFVAMGLLCAAAAIRITIKMIRKEKIEITPVGMMNDLPESVTGISKHSDAIQVKNDRNDD